jgi:hypothetical protein
MSVIAKVLSRSNVIVEGTPISVPNMSMWNGASRWNS